MLNAEPVTPDAGAEVDAGAILRSGAIGAVVVAGIATAIVVAVWFAFYLFVFLPRAMAP